MEPTRVEVDLPVVIINQYGHFELDNHKSIQDVLGQYFEHGDVVTIHLVMESTGTSRAFCTFVDETSSYKSKCGFVLNSDGVCWREEDHAIKRNHQLELEEAE